MHRIKFIHPPRVNRARHIRTILASLTFHGLMIGALLLLTIYCRNYVLPPSGSPPGAPTITLQAMVVQPSTPAPPPMPSPALTPPTVPMPPTSIAKTPQDPIAPEKIPDVGVPVLAMKSPRSAVTKETHHTTTPHTTSSAKPSAASVASNYAPGVNSLPHPPYPTEAQSRGLTGTVVMYVVFNAQGYVARADVQESSGVPMLDTETRTFIRQNWHSVEFAGQPVSVPVQYYLKNN